MGFDAPRVREAFGDLVESGFVEIQTSPPEPGSQRMQVRLTEAGMAVAFGLARAADGACAAVQALEAATLTAIGEQRRRP